MGQGDVAPPELAGPGLALCVGGTVDVGPEDGLTVGVVLALGDTVGDGEVVAGAGCR
jgi:hypothetical protein